MVELKIRVKESVSGTRTSVSGKDEKDGKDGKEAGLLIPSEWKRTRDPLSGLMEPVR
jgi:hypothetical protein